MKLLSINPHDQSIIGETEISTSDEVITSVEKARQAFLLWKETPIKERRLFIKNFIKKLIENKEKIADLTSREMGKPINQAIDDVTGEIDFLNYYYDNAENFLSEEIIYQNEKETYKTIFEPYGVCVCISPWNFPLSMMTSGVIPALLTGNTVVFKPSEYTTLTQKFIFELMNDSGLPNGVANIVIGAGEVGEILTDCNIDLVWFTGSTKVGQKIYEKCGKKFIKSILEMGGSSSAIVFADANLENAIEQIYWGRFLNCGQVCSAVKRLFVEKTIFDNFVKKFTDRVKTTKTGDPLERTSDLGPLVNRKQLIKLEEQVSDATSNGAKIVLGGHQPKDINLQQGNYFEPTIIIDVKPNMSVMTEEVFGPVLPIVPFSDENELIKLVNNTEYGLTNEIYTTDYIRAKQLANKLESGTVAINTDSYFKPFFPFGGQKKSGMGREYGRIGMQEFCQVKSIVTVKI